MNDITNAPIERSALSKLKVAELNQIAQDRGLASAKGLRKGELIDAIIAASESQQPESTEATPGETIVDAPAADPVADDVAPIVDAQEPDESEASPEASAEPVDAASDAGLDSRFVVIGAQSENGSGEPQSRGRRGNRRRATSADANRSDAGSAESSAGEQAADARSEKPRREATRLEDIIQLPEGPTPPNQRDRDDSTEDGDEAAEGSGRDRGRRGRRRDRRSGDRANDRAADRGDDKNADLQQDAAGDDNEDEQSRSRRSRSRDRRRGRTDDFDAELVDSDELLPIAGILDVLDNYAFVRTSGYLSGQQDVYVSLGQVKKYNLRKGDAVVGSIRKPSEGDSNARQKYNALVKVDSVNGQVPNETGERADFQTLTPVRSGERVPFSETADATVRATSLFAPLARGGRLLVSGPSGSGRTSLVLDLVDAIADADSETHLMVVLLDTRPEDVTSIQRRVKGEVIASDFDRVAEDHITVAELAVARAKRLAELGVDVVLVIDSVTALAKAYLTAGNVAKGAGAQISIEQLAIAQSLGVFRSGRKLENNGSITIIGTATTAESTGFDNELAAELRTAQTAELTLIADLADARRYPAIDLLRSSARDESELLSQAEATQATSLRRQYAASDVTTRWEGIVVRALGGRGR